MFLHYILYKKSWISLIILLLIVMNTLIQFDGGISVNSYSLLYLNVLYLIIFLCFFIWRYKKETAYLKALRTLIEQMDDHWVEDLPKPQNRFPDHIMYSFLISVDQLHKKNLHDHTSAQVMEHHYLASWVHEMKAPLTAMKLTIDAHRHQTLAQKLDAQWLRLHLMVDRQLYIARLPSLESDFSVSEVVVEDMIKEEIRELSSWCMEKNISVDIDVAKRTSVLTDKKWCQFVFRQLLANAIKYSPDGESITIKMNHIEQGEVTLGITDQGPGIQPHDLPRIFDKGFTGENGRVQQAATGLGLYLAKEITKNLNIRLDVTSAVGCGTTMYMAFSKNHPFENIRVLSI
ncbi:sensor histidine kinase [Aureibacillus halotolerans]|uniref:histidine kinase n=1 Tax=Aureibacillus halotolerans TaxID=1508390 RepID=A0A4R6TX78_9BACI|nr:sensor histidine kinase [Aureibacillus halotolerans]TDQ37372.1 OmpR family two-component system bacitracin resistance sensor histidine kinase BceS [Aureibacillus halotolerans]